MLENVTKKRSDFLKSTQKSQLLAILTPPSLKTEYSLKRK